MNKGEKYDIAIVLVMKTLHKECDKSVIWFREFRVTVVWGNQLLVSHFGVYLVMFEFMSDRINNNRIFLLNC